VKQFDIECGVSAPSSSNATVLALGGQTKNINLRIDYISRRMVADVPDLLTDLLEIAAYVYCADQRLPRGTSHFSNYGQNWRRSLNLSIPVRNPSVWQREDVQRALVETLGFLSDDSYAFAFSKLRAPSQLRDAYFHALSDTTREPDLVALFSGGVDSFAGAAEDLLLRNHAVSLVAHSSASKVRHVQDTLIADLRTVLAEERGSTHLRAGLGDEHLGGARRVHAAQSIVPLRLPWLRCRVSRGQGPADVLRERRRQSQSAPSR
jgi:hypothetical protein